MGKQITQPVEFNKVNPKSKNQANFIKSIHDNDITICNGPAGSGKSLLAISTACDYLLQGKIDKILISRTIVAAGHDLGAFKGDIDEKVSPYFLAQAEYLNQILGKNYKNLLNNKIFLRPLEILRGHSYHNAIIILDEASNCDAFQIKLFISRLGEKSKAIIIGDCKQKDVETNGLNFCLNYLKDISNCAICQLSYDDIFRNKNIAEILKIFDNAGI